MQESSPRPWGCFQERLDVCPGQRVFPTPVGVFLEHPQRPTHFESLPHARGGVSQVVRLFFGVY